MLHIVFLILKIILFLILAVLGLLLAIALAVLLVPIRYRAGPQLLIGKQTSAMMQRQLQHLVQIEHCSIAPTQIIPLRRQLNTADNGIIHCILMGNPQLLQFSYNCFIIEKLRHTASLCHDANSLL